MGTSQPFRGSGRHHWAALIVLAGAACAAAADQTPPSGTMPSSDSGSSDEPKSLPQDGFFSSIKQSLREGDQEIIRGHFDLGTPPNVHRYYCLMDPKTRRREPNGVLGEPLPRPDGMTGIKSSAVSLYRCEKAEQQGLLITAGYLVPAHPGTAPAQPAAAPPPPAAAVPAAPAPTPLPAAAAAPPPVLAPSVAADRIDVAGVELGMSPEQVRRVLKAKGLRDYKEWTESLSYLDAAQGGARTLPDGRFVNVIAAWSAPAAADDLRAAGEAFEVMFTPVPGHERAMAIVHSVGYAPADAVRETALETGLARKYGGFRGGGDVPQSPTWRFQSGGAVKIGDSCGRRGLFGGLGALSVGRARENIALARPIEELRYQSAECGSAIVTEDHFTADAGALPEERVVTRFTVTAYSPELALEGRSAAERLLQAAGHAVNPAAAPGNKSDRVPDL